MVTREYLLSVGVEFDREYTLIPEVDSNSLSLGGLRGLDRIVAGYINKVAAHNFRLDLPNIVNLHRNVGDSWGLYKFDNKTFGVRYRDYVRSISDGLTIPSNLVSRLSEEANRLKGQSDDSKIIYDFHVGSDWAPGRFHESTGSCWWSDYDGGRVVSSDMGQLCAIRFFDAVMGRRDGWRGIGRAWLWYDRGALLLFNLYHAHDFTKSDAARAVCNTLKGFDYTPVEVRHGNMYVNGCSGLAIFPSGSRVPDYYEIRVEGLERCDICDNYVDADTLVQTIRGDWVCEDCIYHYYHECDSCGGWVRDGYGMTVGSVQYCEECLFDQCSRCDHCGDWVNNDRLNNGLCEFCHERTVINA